MSHALRITSVSFFLTTFVITDAFGERFRPRIENGNLVADNGMPLRGEHHFVLLNQNPATGNLYSWQDLRDQWHLNTIRLLIYREPAFWPGGCDWDCDESDNDYYHDYSPVDKLLAFIDCFVDQAANEGFYLIIDYHPVGGYDEANATEFWTAIAPRYATRRHVIYEVCNEPTSWGPDPGIAPFESRMYSLIRSHAPVTPIIHWSVAHMKRGYRDMVNAAPSISYQRAAVGFHAYVLEQDALDAVRSAYPVINTEIGGTTFQEYESVTQNMESQGISWVWLNGYAENPSVTWPRDPLALPNHGVLGWQTSYVPAYAGPPVGGFEVLANRNYAIFDGRHVKEIRSSDGGFVRNLYTPPSGTKGSFLRRSPDGTKLWFGAGRGSGDLWEINLTNLQTRWVARVPYNYDMDVDPFGRAFVSAGQDSTWWCDVYYLNLQNGSIDIIVNLDTPPGPISFWWDGSLFVGAPGDPHRAKVLRYTKSQVDSGFGSPVLHDRDGAIYAEGLAGVTDMDFDNQGDLWVVEDSYGTVGEVRGTQKSTVWNGEGWGYPIYARFLDGTGCGDMEAFQPDSAGSLNFISSDGATFNAASRVRPARPTAQANSIIPPGPFTVDFDGGPRSGTAFVLLALDAFDDDTSVRMGGGTMCMAIDFSRFITLWTLRLDNYGSIRINGYNPGIGDINFAFQAMVGEGTSLYGTSNALEVLFR